ncbi:MAG: 50S ribosomal protein L18 [Flavobacteriales bacterium]
MPYKKLTRRDRIRKRIRKRISGTSERPRLSVFRSNSHIYAQLIDDENERTLATVSSIALNKGSNMKKTEVAQLVGKAIAENAAKTGITSVVFDRNGYLFHGRVKALADSARASGLKF